MRTSRRMGHHARRLRTEMTRQERALWTELRNRQLGNRRFRRQHVVGPYILDFVCLSDRLVIEVDGGQHAENPLPDVARDHWLREHGFRILRFWNHQVDEELEAILEAIQHALGPGMGCSEEQ
jgi:very-short-patch-repair endonuclease